ncbi:glycosyltransferase 87 family protein [Arthrobacter silvisoli]|uniref:glycosyltransferase 87 family protein n=1 Tax=Arthrobacter silvisoli TaxID=2291022 RepID=UPI000E20ED7C|nr:glycosyltransferase 87 family protein [Arthrobacter silvisoli]
MGSDPSGASALPAAHVPSPRGWVLTAFGGLLLAAAVWFLYKDYKPFLNDFEVYYYGGSRVLESGDSLYAPRDGLPFTYPPFAAVLFAGLATMGFGAGSMVFILSALFGAAVVAAWLSRHYFGMNTWRATFADYRFRTTTAVGTGAILLLGPWRDTFVFGQINIILMGVILADFALHGKVRAGQIRWPAGLLTGLAAGVKLTPLVFGLYFLVRRDFKALSWMAVGFFGSIAAGWAVLPQASVAFWMKILPDTGRIGQPDFVDNLSLKGLLLHLGLPDSAQTSLEWAGLSLGLVALTVLVIKWALDVDENFIAVSATAVLMLLISPVSWSHHWVWMAVALPGMAFAMHRVPSRQGRMRRAGWVIVACSTLAFYLTPKNIAVLAGAAEWGKGVETQFQLSVSSLGVLCGIALLVYWAFAYRPARTGIGAARAGAVRSS